MGFDIVSFLMGKAAGGGGSGGEKTLLTSGWVNSYSSNTEITGNTVNFNTGSVAHKVFISPPAFVERDTKFPANSTIKIAVTVSDANPRVMIEASYSVITSASGLFVERNASSSYAAQTGQDVLTVKFSNQAANVVFKPVNSTNNESSDTSGTIQITGIEYNGEIIYGSVTPPNP